MEKCENGDHGQGIDNPLRMISAATGDKYIYLKDGRGSVYQIVGSESVWEGGRLAYPVAKSYQYDSFGNIVSETGTLENPFAYTGREWEPELGLYYYRARWYDPSIGRFLSEDPIGFMGGDENLYRYVGNNVANLTDPEGTGPISGIICVGIDVASSIGQILDIRELGNQIEDYGKQLSALDAESQGCPLNSKRGMEIEQQMQDIREKLLKLENQKIREELTATAIAGGIGIGCIGAGMAPFLP